MANGEALSFMAELMDVSEKVLVLEKLRKVDESVK